MYSKLPERDGDRDEGVTMQSALMHIFLQDSLAEHASAVYSLRTEERMSK